MLLTGAFLQLFDEQQVGGVGHHADEHPDVPVGAQEGIIDWHTASNTACCQQPGAVACGWPKSVLQPVGQS